VVGVSEVKIFRIRGQAKLHLFTMGFEKEIRALKVEDALDKLYTELGSKHRLKRKQIKIFDVKEITPSEANDPLIKRLAEIGA